MLRAIIIATIIAIIFYLFYMRVRGGRSENFYSDVVTAAPFDLILNNCRTNAEESCYDAQYNQSLSALPLSAGTGNEGTDGSISLYRPKFDGKLSQLAQEAAGRDDRMYTGLVRRVPILPTIDAPGCSVNFIPQENCLTAFDSCNSRLFDDPADSTLRSRKQFIDSGNGETLMRRTLAAGEDIIPLGHSISNMPDISSAFVQLKLAGCKEQPKYNMYDFHHIDGGNDIAILQTGGRVIPSTQNTQKKDMNSDKKA